eukprot:366071-Chlamydomonas_euryale.AAC.1
MVRKACEPMTSAETKDVEAACGVVRLDKTKAEQAAKPKAGAHVRARTASNVPERFLLAAMWHGRRLCDWGWARVQVVETWHGCQLCGLGWGWAGVQPV